MKTREEKVWNYLIKVLGNEGNNIKARKIFDYLAKQGIFKKMCRHENIEYFTDGSARCEDCASVLNIKLK